MASRISPLWMPLWLASSPVVAVKALRENRAFREDRARAEALNRGRFAAAAPLDLPELETLALTPIVEHRAADGFRSDPGVSYLIETDRGTLLFDMGFGAATPTLAHNLGKMSVDWGRVEGLVISHLHADHVGGMEAARRRCLSLPPDLAGLKGKPCYLPDLATVPDMEPVLVAGPRMVGMGIGVTGPLARGMFFHGICEEQALVARVRGRGLVVITGCGHPTVGVILEMVRRVSSEPIHALAGGLHFPVTESRWKRRGIQVQMFMGTGKPPWRRITDDDLSRMIADVNAAGIRRVLISAHDSCDHALDRMRRELHAEATVLQAGATYCL